MTKLSQFYIYEQKLPSKGIQWVVKSKASPIEPPNWMDAVVFVGNPGRAVKLLFELQDSELRGKEFSAYTRTVVNEYSGKKLIYLEQENDQNKKC